MGSSTGGVSGDADWKQKMTSRMEELEARMKELEKKEEEEESIDETNQETN